MANEKYKGRNFLVQIENSPGSGTYTTVSSMRSTSLSVNNAQVDVTEKDGAPWRELLASAGLKSMSITAAGPIKNTAVTRQLMAAVFSTTGGDILNFKIVSGFGDTVVGAFQVAGIDRAGEFAGEETYNLKLESSGTPTYTPAA
jgi:TP901-1 family phage major tail protein